METVRFEKKTNYTQLNLFQGFPNGGDFSSFKGEN